MESLNEHISRMLELFEVQHGVIKPLLEQDDVTQSGRFKDKNNNEILFDDKFFESFNVTAANQKKYREMNPNFDAQLSELRKHPAYELLISKIQGDTNAMTIFYFQLVQSSRIIFLDKTLEFLRSFTKRKKLQKELESNPNYTGADELYDWSAEIVQGQETKTDIPVEKKDEIEYQDFEVPLQVGGKTVFVDNSIEPDSSLTSAIEKWVNDAKSVIDEAKNISPNVTVELLKVEIASSCSRLRNTGSYVGKTWAKLSNDRSENVYKILVEKLQGINVTISPEVQKIIKGGYNGDGSSGPDPAKKFLFDTAGLTNNMSYSTNGADQLYGPDSKRKIEINGVNYGQLLATQAESHQYKFCVVIATLRIKSSSQQITPLKPAVSYTKGYSLVLAPMYYEKPKKLPKKLKGAKGAYKSKGGNNTGVLQRTVMGARKIMGACPEAYGG